MNKLELLTLAKQGDKKAINTLIDLHFKSKNTKSKINFKDNCVFIMLESGQVPHQQSSINNIRQIMIDLGGKEIKLIKVYAKKIGDDFPEWEEEFGLDETVNNYFIPNVEPEIDIQQAIQNFLGNKFIVKLTKTRSQVSVVITKLESNNLDRRGLINFLKKHDLINPSYWQAKQIKKFNVFESENLGKKSSLKSLVKIVANPENNLREEKINHLLGIPINFVAIAFYLMFLILPIAVGYFPKTYLSKPREISTLKLETTNYCPSYVKSSPPKSDDDLYNYFRVTGPVIDKFGLKGRCVHIDIYINKKFTDKQQEIIKVAAQIMAKRAMQEQTFRCTYKTAYRNYKGYSVENDEYLLRNGVWSSMVYVDTSDKSESEKVVILKGGTLYIDNMEKDPNALGRGRLNYFYRYGHLRIQLNTDFLDNKDSRNYEYEDPKFWAGVIIHEILHNLGWTHEVGGWWNQSVKGTVIGSFEECIRY